MPVTTIDVGAAADDGRFSGTATFFGNGATVPFGDENQGVYDWGAQFDSVNVPQGATINSATLRLQAVSYFEGAPPMNNWGTLYGEDADNATTLGTGAGSPEGWTKTTATGTWFTDMPTTVPSLYTFNITGIVQEIINRTGWASGNNLNLGAICSTDVGDAYNVLRLGAYSGYPGPGSNTVPRLVINYTAGGGTAVKDVIGRGLIPFSR